VRGPRRRCRRLAPNVDVTNPYAGQHACPRCGSAAFTVPAPHYGLGPWRCTACSVAFPPEADR
jgi:ribosomal protein L37AE/L43A